MIKRLMTATQHVDNLILGSGEAGKYLAWTLAKAGQRSARSSSAG